MEDIENNSFTEEWINGTIISSPRPGYNHMKILKTIGFRLEEHFNNKYEVALANTLFLTKENPTEIKKDIVRLRDLVLSKQAELVPDIAVYTDKEQIFKRGFLGIPELTIEILDEENEEKDLIIKKEVYEKFGVPEYLIVSPMSKKAYVYVLENERYELNGEYKFLEEEIKLNEFKDLVLDIRDIKLYDYNNEEDIRI